MIASLLVGAALAASVPVEEAAYHRLLVANADYAILDVHFPPGTRSGFHLHPRQLFYTVITPAEIKVQMQGQAARTVAPTAAGTVGMNELGTGPYIHEVSNGAAGPYHVIGIELRRPAPIGALITPRGPETRFSQIHDHPRLRAWRLILQPGETAPALRTIGTGVRIFVHGGSLTITRPDKPGQQQLVAAGDFEPLVPENRGLTNSGDTPIELVDVELK